MPAFELCGFKEACPVMNFGDEPYSKTCSLANEQEFGAQMSYICAHIAVMSKVAECNQFHLNSGLGLGPVHAWS